MSDPQPDRHVNDRPRTVQSVHILAYALLGCLFAYVLIARYFRPLVLGDSIGVEPARIEQVQQRIDPNTAPWQELSRLPEIGESLAKEIVRYREEQSSARTGPAFRRAQDLDAIKGIGEKTLEQIAPHLKFPETAKSPSRRE